MSHRLTPTRFWLEWIFANAWAELAGLGAIAALGYFVAKQLGEPSDVATALISATLFIVLGGIEGLVIGVAQNQVLRQALPQLTGWVQATLVGAMVSWAVGMVPSTVMSALSRESGAAAPEISESVRLLLAVCLGVVAGPLLAFFQWRCLRRHVLRAWLWLPANGVAWAIGMPIIFFAAHLAASQTNTLAVAGTIGVSFLLAGAVVGAVHGGVLVWLTTRCAARCE
jgi:hypothetical protein